MNLIDSTEERIIKEITDNLSEKSINLKLNSPYHPIENTSYWHKRDEWQNQMDIMEYDFNTPLELQHLLKKVINEEYCNEYLVPLTVAAFKQRKVSAAKGNVSQYIYEF